MHTIVWDFARIICIDSKQLRAGIPTPIIVSVTAVSRVLCTEWVPSKHYG